VGIHILEMVSNINSISDREHQPIKRLSFELQGERTGKDTETSLKKEKNTFFIYKKQLTQQ
jgi:hypothetical protein